MNSPGTMGWRQVVLLIGLAWSCGQPVRGQEPSRWRVYREPDGLVENFVLSVTVSPRGHVWIRHPGTASVGMLDGYQARVIPGMEENRFPVWESRSGQVWSLNKVGLAEFKRDEWIVYPVDGIRDEHQTNTMRAVRSIPLLPAERDHVLVLLSQALIKVNPASARVEQLRSAATTHLGEFTDIAESRDGGVWITGLRGVTRLAGPIRMLAPETPWPEHLVNEGWGLSGLTRPVEDDAGNLVVVGEQALDEQRVILVFDGEDWQPPKPAPEGTRAAWNGLGGRLLAQAKGTLYESSPDDQWRPVAIPGLPRAQIIDAAFEPGGVYWLATSEGLVRHAPETWRRPPGMGHASLDVLGMVEQRGVGVWMVSPDALYLLRDGQWRTWSWPAGFTPSGQASRLVQWLEGQQVLIASDKKRPLIFDLNSERFQSVEHPEGRAIIGVLGVYRPGAVFLETADQEGNRRMEVFDGSRFTRWPEDRSSEVSLDDVVFVDGTAGNRLWMARTNGLTVWEPGLGQFAAVPGAPGGTMYAILAVAGGRIWFGGEGTIVEYDGRSWQVLRTGFGRIHSLRGARDGTVWVASEAGLWSYADRAWLGYGSQEGFPPGAVKDVLPDQDGAVYAATAGGLLRYYREADLDEPSSYFAVDTPRQTPTTRQFTVHYAARDKWNYTPAERLVYSHRLNEGMWTPFEEASVAVLTNLTAGEHRLAVRAMDRNRNEELEPAVWEFVAFVPWYAEPRIVVVAGGGLLVAGFLTWLAVNRHLRLRRSHTEVERIVEQRTRELQEANRELLHSQKMRALGTLAAGIAHDFNSILSIIKGSAQIIEHHPDDQERIRTRVSRIKTMVEQGSGIVQAMLGFSRGTALAMQTCDLSQLVTETVRLVGDQTGSRATIECEVPSQPVPVLTVAAMVRQVLLNLVFNALEASGGEGVIRLNVWTILSPPADMVLAPAPADAYVRIDVVDRGHGIPAEIQSRVFEPFFTTKAFSTRRGTGLGLSMVYEIAKELGLGLRLESQPGQGSTFSLVVPRQRGMAPVSTS